MKKRHLNLGVKDRKELESLLSKDRLTVKVFKQATALLELDRGKALVQWP
jgi:hypothetical protein